MLSTLLGGVGPEIISSAFGAIMGFWTKSSAQKTEMLAAERKHTLDTMLAASTAHSKQIDDEVKLLKAQKEYEVATAKADPHRSVARRVIAYIMVAAVAVFIPILFAFTTLHWFDIHTFTETTKGFFGIGATSKETIKVITATGLPLAWLEGLFSIVGLIVSFYFGQSAARMNNPYLK